jgi:hypothetical protein
MRTLKLSSNPVSALRKFGHSLRDGRADHLAGDLALRPSNWLIVVVDCWSWIDDAPDNEKGQTFFVYDVYLYTREQIQAAEGLPSLPGAPDRSFRSFYAIPPEAVAELESMAKK